MSFVFLRVMSDYEREMNCKRPSNSKFDLQLRRADGDPLRTRYHWDETDGKVFNPNHRARSAPNSLMVRNFVFFLPVVSECLSIYPSLSVCLTVLIFLCLSFSVSLSLSFSLSFFLSLSLSFSLSFFLSFFLFLIKQTIEATLGLTEEKRKFIDKEEYDKQYRDNM